MMCGCVGRKGEGRGLAIICIIGCLFFVVSTVLFGCAGAPVPEPIQRDLCPNCEISDKLARDIAKAMTMASDCEMAADRLEDALSAAEEKYLACEDNWVRYQRKSK